jgi:hypothetical protein
MLEKFVDLFNVLSGHSHSRGRLTLRQRALAHHLQERMGADTCSISPLVGRLGKLLGRSLDSAWRRPLGKRDNPKRRRQYPHRGSAQGNPPEAMPQTCRTKVEELETEESQQPTAQDVPESDASPKGALRQGQWPSTTLPPAVQEWTHLRDAEDPTRCW